MSLCLMNGGTARSFGGLRMNNGGVYALDDAPPFLSSFGGLRITMMWCMPWMTPPFLLSSFGGLRMNNDVVYACG